MKKPIESITQSEAQMLLDMLEDGSIILSGWLSKTILEKKAGKFEEKKASAGNIVLGYNSAGSEITVDALKKDKSLFEGITRFTEVGTTMRKIFAENQNEYLQLSNADFDKLVARYKGLDH